MISYHITTKDYENGIAYSIENFDGVSYYHQSLANPEQQYINDVIDDCRPQNAPSRKKCFYTFGDIDYCLGFIDNPDGYKLYQVEINTNVPHPMCLIDFINGHKNLVQSLAPIYWDQERTEKFWIKEYIGTEMRIIRRLDLPPNHCIARSKMIMNYDHDKDLCSQLCHEMGIQI